MKTFGPKRDNVRELRNGGLLDLCRLPNVLSTVKCRRLRCGLGT
jgi:hypothetical protein